MTRKCFPLPQIFTIGSLALLLLSAGCSPRSAAAVDLTTGPQVTPVLINATPPSVAVNSTDPKPIEAKPAENLNSSGLVPSYENEPL
ncbi:MAG: hypothetical protein ACYC6H_02595, partial [Bellilinea sp.]